RERAAGDRLDHRSGDPRTPYRPAQEAGLAGWWRRGARPPLCLGARRRIHPARHGCVTGDDDMNDQRKVKRPPSLLERAADMFGIDPAANAPTIDVSNLPPEPEKKAKKAKAEPAIEAPQPEIPEPV